MNLEAAHRVVKNLPHMSFEQAQTVVALLAERGSKDILELGFRHGVSTCYMAAGLEEMGRDWHITTIDRLGAAKLTPNVEQLLQSLHLDDRVTVFYEPTSYTWRMMKMLQEDPTPRFDFCYLDGAHSWFVDGFAFFLIDRLLKPGGWILFDDMDWSYASSPALRDTEMVRDMPSDESHALQMTLVFDLLVKTHPNFSEFSCFSGWGLAQKQESAADGPTPIRRELITKEVGLGAVAKQVLRAAQHRIAPAQEPRRRTSV